MDAGYLDEFDVKKYVKKRLLEIKDEDEYALAKSVLYDGLYKMSEVFEESPCIKKYMMSLKAKKKAMRLQYFYFLKMTMYF